MTESAKKSNPLQEKLNWILTIAILVLVVVVPPMLCGLFYLSRVPDVRWERNNGLSMDRVWMYRERRPIGIAYQGHRVQSQYSDTEVCLETKLRFYLWGNSRLVKPATSYQKMILVDDQWQPTGTECY